MATLANAKFTQQLWDSIEDIYAAILRHPFITGLTDGTLPRQSFLFYVMQDSLYLREFARALSVTAARAPLEDWILLFNEHAAATLRVERVLHSGFLDESGLGPADVVSTPAAPTNLAYTSYLLATAYARPFHEALAALLPCYWIYWEVGQQLARQGSPEPLYRRWIEAYASEEFRSLVEAVLQIADAVAEHLSADERRAMLRHFLIASRYEWMFWDMGFRREAWP